MKIFKIFGVIFLLFLVLILTLLIANIPFEYWLSFDLWKTINPNIGNVFRYILLGGVGLFVLFVFLISKPNSYKRFGDARFATNAEIKKFGYFIEDGLILGQTKNNKLIMSNASTTVGLCAKPRSGKGVSMVIPNMLNWDGSAVVIDIKKEIFNITSGFRSKHGQKIIVFDPLGSEKKSNRINIFDGISKDIDMRITDVQRIAKTIIPTKDPFWDSGARSIFIGIALYLLETNQILSFGSIYRFANDGTDLQDKFSSILESTKLSKECIAPLFNFATIENEKVSGGFLDTFNSRLEPFSNTLIAAATDFSDFDFEKIRDVKTTIYLVARPEHISLLGDLFALITETIIFSLTNYEPKKDEKGKVLFMFDEFTALGQMERVKKGSAYFGGYGIRLVMVYQNEAQLQETYKPIAAREITSLIHERIIFAPSDIDEASKISTELGTYTVNIKNKSKSKGGVSYSYSDASKNLMSADKILQMPNDDQLILSTERRPILCKKIFYYKDKRFKSRLYKPFDGEIPKLVATDYNFINVVINETETEDNAPMFDI